MTNLKLTEQQKDKLVQLGVKYLLERMELADFPLPKPKVDNRRKGWTPARLRKFRATMKRKKLGHDKKGND